MHLLKYCDEVLENNSNLYFVIISCVCTLGNHNGINRKPNYTESEEKFGRKKFGFNLKDYLPS